MTNAVLDLMRNLEQIHGTYWALHELELQLEYTLKVSKWKEKPRNYHYFLGIDYNDGRTVRQFHQIYMILRDQGKWEEE
jgi:hypothetical protein